MNKKLYQKNWFIWLMLILFAPIGIILLWVNKKYSTKIRTILSGVFIIYFFIIAAAVNNDQNSSLNTGLQIENQQDGTLAPTTNKSTRESVSTATTKPNRISTHTPVPTNTPLPTNTPTAIPTSTPNPTPTPTPVIDISLRVTLKTAQMLSNNSVGNDWSYTCWVNNEYIGKGDTIDLTAKSDSKITLNATAKEHDKFPDSGSNTLDIDIKDISTTEKIYKIEVTVKENRGRYSGNTAKWLFEFTVNRE